MRIFWPRNFHPAIAVSPFIRAFEQPFVELPLLPGLLFSWRVRILTVGPRNSIISCYGYWVGVSSKFLVSRRELPVYFNICACGSHMLVSVTMWIRSWLGMQFPSHCPAISDAKGNRYGGVAQRLSKLLWPHAVSWVVATGFILFLRESNLISEQEVGRYWEGYQWHFRASLSKRARICARESLLPCS